MLIFFAAATKLDMNSITRMYNDAWNPRLHTACIETVSHWVHLEHRLTPDTHPSFHHASSRTCASSIDGGMRISGVNAPEEDMRKVFYSQLKEKPLVDIRKTIRQEIQPIVDRLECVEQDPRHLCAHDSCVWDGGFLGILQSEAERCQQHWASIPCNARQEGSQCTGSSDARHRCP